MKKFTIVIPTINRADLLKESYEDMILNKVLENVKLIVIDNGNQDLSFINHPNATIIRNKKNLGVAGSWNLGIEESIKLENPEWVLVLNDDIVWGLTYEEMSEILKDNKTAHMITGPYHWSIFAIKVKTFNTVGLFDNGFFPAYFEDNDYHYRVKLMGKDISFDKRLEPKVKRNSQTIEKDPKLNSRFIDNQNRYIDKWGGLPGNETRRKPFSD